MNRRVFSIIARSAGSRSTLNAPKNPTYASSPLALGPHIFRFGNRSAVTEHDDLRLKTYPKNSHLMRFYRRAP